jgi:hypothetical protein
MCSARKPRGELARQSEPVRGFRINNTKTMKAYHPPMTALEAHMEEEIAHEAHRPDEAFERARELREQTIGNAVPQKPATDVRAEQAMQLGQ